MPNIYRILSFSNSHCTNTVYTDSFPKAHVSKSPASSPMACPFSQAQAHSGRGRQLLAQTLFERKQQEPLIGAAHFMVVKKINKSIENTTEPLFPQPQEVLRLELSTPPARGGLGHHTAQPVSVTSSLTSYANSVSTLRLGKSLPSSCKPGPTTSQKQFWPHSAPSALAF